MDGALTKDLVNRFARADRGQRRLLSSVFSCNTEGSDEDVPVRARLALGAAPRAGARGPESLLHSSRRAAGQRARSTHVASTIQPTVLSILLGNSTRFLDIQNNRIRLLSYRIRRPGCRSSTLGMNDGMKLYEAALAALGHFTQPAQPNRSLVILRDPIIHTMAGTARGRFRRARITRVMPMMW